MNSNASMPPRAVEARWQQLILTWQRQRDDHEVRAPGSPFPDIVALLEAARAEPRLRELFPFTSDHTLRLSTSTTFPYDVQAPAVDPLPDGRFRVCEARSSRVIGYAASADEAVRLVTANLPEGLGPAS
ncbi:DUF6193 family natural product biosynthesis protein [Streptomyces sp. NPDC086023]|uniref:DUF6193 family natural product biosynthesis protein n=1 Tax=Streptomyces sp. NPDC086023 TaxID=3365746 RepID=UPI0037D0F71D